MLAKFLNEVKKVWGKEFWVVNNELYCMKYLRIEPGGFSSLHSHTVKDETFHVTEGWCYLSIDGEERLMNTTDTVRILPGQKHRFWVPKKADGCTIVEISTHHDDEDVTRYQESYKL
jgi:quercetin dioxygenase-like cupin family protein